MQDCAARALAPELPGSVPLLCFLGEETPPTNERTVRSRPTTCTPRTATGSCEITQCPAGVTYMTSVGCTMSLLVTVSVNTCQPGATPETATRTSIESPAAMLLPTRTRVSSDTVNTTHCTYLTAMPPQRL